MRYNTFYQVHKALRAMLYETASSCSVPILTRRRSRIFAGKYYNSG
jgi:hypothetical protein